MINRSPVHFTIDDMFLCDSCLCSTGLESTYSLVSSVVSYGTMALSLHCRLFFSSWNAYACFGPQENFCIFLVRMRRGSVTSGYNAWPTFPPRDFTLNCTVCRKLFTSLQDFGWGQPLSILHFAGSSDMPSFLCRYCKTVIPGASQIRIFSSSGPNLFLGGQREPLSSMCHGLFLCHVLRCHV